MTGTYGRGHQLGDYRLDSLLGRGGMGEVYRATDTRRGRVVALKLLPAHLADDDAFRTRFERESRIAASLGDPHIVPIHDWGEIDGALFLDMRLVDGKSLGDRLREATRIKDRRPLSETVAIVEQIAGALDHAHTAGLVHRDVKPDNILIDNSGFAYLTDFGIAHSLGDPRLTATGAAIGSIAYMAPERFSDVPIDGAVDIYALACILFEGITGRPPYGSADFAQTMRGHLFDPIPVTGTALDGVISRGLAKAPTDRFPTASALALAARAAIDGPPAPWQPTQQAPVGYRASPLAAAPPPPTMLAPMPPQTPPPNGRRRAAIAVAAAVVAALAIAGTGYALVSINSRSSGNAEATTTESSTAASSSTVSCLFTTTTPTGRTVPPPASTQPSTDLGALRVRTSGGTLQIQLNDGAPCNSAAIVALAKAQYFSGATCNRVSDYILMCGAPTLPPGSTDIQAGLDSPGWTSPNEFPSNLQSSPGDVDGLGRQQVVYPVGTVAIANPNGPSDSGGAGAFFIVLKPAITAPVYSILGTVDSAGLQVAQSVAASGFRPSTPGSNFGTPIKTLTISGVSTD